MEKFIRANDIPAHIGFKGLINLEREYDEDGNIKTYCLSDAYAISRAVLTTSTLEGFGFVFLEPWRTDSFLIGRNIHDVTHDFHKEAGMKFSHLYEKLTVNGVDFPKIGTKPSQIAKSGNILKSEELEAKLNIVKNIADNDFFMSFIEENCSTLEDIVASLKQPEENQYLIGYNKHQIDKFYSKDVSAVNFVSIIEDIMDE
jgi:hypothetical protein